MTGAINTPSLALAEANRQRDQPSAPQDLDAMERVARAEMELANLREWRWSFDPLTLTHAMVVGLLAEVNDNDAGRDLAETLEAVRDNLTVAARDLQAAEARIKVLEETFGRLAEELDRAALDRQAWADHPGIGGDKPKLASHLRGKRYGYSHAAQLIRAALQLGGENG